MNECVGRSMHMCKREIYFHSIRKLSSYRVLCIGLKSFFIVSAYRQIMSSRWWNFYLVWSYTLLVIYVFTKVWLLTHYSYLCPELMVHLYRNLVFLAWHWHPWLTWGAAVVAGEDVPFSWPVARWQLRRRGNLTLSNKVLIQVLRHDMRILNCMEILVVLGRYNLYGLIFMSFVSMLPWLLNHKVFCSVAAIYFATCLAGL
jgi:hypothetical protein